MSGYLEFTLNRSSPRPAAEEEEQGTGMSLLLMRGYSRD
jgi:hypothetical protein